MQLTIQSDTITSICHLFLFCVLVLSGKPSLRLFYSYGLLIKQMCKNYTIIYYQSASFSSSKDAVVKAYFKDPFNTPTVVKDNTNTKLLH